MPLTEEENIPAIAGNIHLNLDSLTLGNGKLTPTDIYLTGALLYPQSAANQLCNYTNKGKIIQDDFPIIRCNNAWAAAAWELYCATGSRQCLRESYRIISSSLAYESAIAPPTGGNLVYGVPEYLTPTENYFPEWMTPVDCYQCLCLGNNVWYYNVLSTLCRMSAEQRLYATREWENLAAKTRSSINDCFWVPEKSYYGQYLYGAMYPILSTGVDCRANTLAVIFGIPTQEMSVRLISALPELSDGMPAIYPLKPEIKPEFTRQNQALRGIAAARTGNISSLLSAIMSLQPEDDAAPDLAYTALLLRGILGITLDTGGITFNPTIPSQLGSETVVTNLKYRDAIIDVIISGTGNKIASCDIDSLHADTPFIAASAGGRHKVYITMTGNKIDETGNTPPKLSAAAVIPRTPALRWIDDRNVTILDYNRNISYEVYLNGILSECLISPTYSVTDTGTVVVDIVPVIDNVGGYSPRSHVTANHNAHISIPATAITPRRAPLHLIHDKKMAGKYIELAARHNTRLTFYVQTPADGEYFLNITYSNGSNETAVRSLEINNTIAGTIICPSVKKNDWISTGLSSTQSVHLNKGVNKLSLTYHSNTILLHNINLLRK